MCFDKTTTITIKKTSPPTHKQSDRSRKVNNNEEGGTDVTHFVDVAVGTTADPLDELVLVLGVAPADVARQGVRVNPRHCCRLASFRLHPALSRAAAAAACILRRHFTVHTLHLVQLARRVSYIVAVGCGCWRGALGGQAARIYRASAIIFQEREREVLAAAALLIYTELTAPSACSAVIARTGPSVSLALCRLRGDTYGGGGLVCSAGGGGMSVVESTGGTARCGDPLEMCAENRREAD